MSEKSPYMEVLTKENFWNDLNQKYPEQMKVFCDWIDEYKRRVDWNTLFNGDFTPSGHGYARSPKYHEIPIAMQIGIFYQFLDENRDKYRLKGVRVMKMQEMIDGIMFSFGF